MSGTGNILVVSVQNPDLRDPYSRTARLDRGARTLTIFSPCTSLHHACTNVHKRYKPYTLRIIYLINLIFCEILCPEHQNHFKYLRFLFFFCAQKKTPWN